ncbi:hypothetical protein PSHT_00587 [Puccinia striiformis]|uniref:DUF6589 domain-containing protein n=3 Tax=Puccinia striiformis TaxID=27350 RepID=A0A2S4WMT3_9BASI|nr:hypothetical protein PSHT_00587 [Puccinia striiformis]
MRLLPLIRNEVLRTQGGKDAWAAFIQPEAVNILVSEEAPRGVYPRGSFLSSLAVHRAFFTPEVQQNQDTARTTTHMPFLYGLIMGMFHKRGLSSDTFEDENARESANVHNDLEGVVGDQVPEMYGEVAFVKLLTGKEQAFARCSRVATTICSIVAFSLNRRDNSLQLLNSVRFYACGVSERLQEYLNHLGLCSSRKTAMSSLKTLSKEGEAGIKKAMAVRSNCPIAPTICIDNIDMEERVHDLSVGNRSHTYRGTWGYVHVPNPTLIQSLNWDDLSLDSYQKSIEKFKNFSIEPAHFMPTAEARESEIDVFKSQIARVLLKHLAIPSNKSKAIPTNPPTLDQISHEKPTIHMLKLMDAPMDGDLGTIQNFNSLRSQRAPSPYGQDSLHNVIFQLGASHTMWNIASTIFTHHFGDSSDQSDTGAWQYLEALGFPSEKAIQKKDFTLMINQMEKILEATFYYCLRVIMKNETEMLGDELVTLPTERWNAIVNECYERFCSPHARRTAAQANYPQLSNTLIMLHDFSSVVEAKRSMKAGDVGRLMNVWKKWCLMTQGLTGLTNYSSYLPRMVLQLTHILPPALQKYLCHNMLFSPTGRKNHFVAKDHWLETQNYSLKFLFNQTGNGTSWDRLRDIFSVNIELLQSMFQSLKTDCGASVIHQSHKNELTSRSLDMFMQMANNRDILAQKLPKQTPISKLANKEKPKLKRIDNTYLTGFAKMKRTIRTKDPDMKKMKKHLFAGHRGNVSRELDDEDSEKDETSSVDM